MESQIEQKKDKKLLLTLSGLKKILFRDLVEQGENTQEIKKKNKNNSRSEKENLNHELIQIGVKQEAIDGLFLEDQKKLLKALKYRKYKYKIAKSNKENLKNIKPNRYIIHFGRNNELSVHIIFGNCSVYVL